MTHDDKKMDWGQARVEVTALMPEIDQYLADNHTRTTIFKMLKRDGKLTCGLSTFCRWVDRLSDEHPPKVKSSALPVTKNVTEKIESQPLVVQKSTSEDKTPSEPSSVLVARPKMKRFEN